MSRREGRVVMMLGVACARRVASWHRRSICMRKLQSRGEMKDSFLRLVEWGVRIDLYLAWSWQNIGSWDFRQNRRSMKYCCRGNTSVEDLLCGQLSILDRALLWWNGGVSLRERMTLKNGLHRRMRNKKIWLYNIWHSVEIFL